MVVLHCVEVLLHLFTVVLCHFVVILRLSVIFCTKSGSRPTGDSRGQESLACPQCVDSWHPNQQVYIDDDIMLADSVCYKCARGVKKAGRSKKNKKQKQYPF